MAAVERRRGSSVREQLAALWRRDIAIELSYQFQFLMRFVSTVLTVAPFYFIAKMVGSPDALRPYGGDYFGFVLIGLIVRTFAGTGLGAFGRALQQEQTMGTLELLLASPARYATVLAGTFLVPAMLTTAQAIVYVAAGVLVFGARFDPQGMLFALPILALTMLSFSSLGIFSAAFIVLTKRGDPVSQVMRDVTSLLAGAVFPVALMPLPLQLLGRLVPATYGIEALRRVMLTGASLGAVRGEIGALALFSAVTLPLSLWAFASAVSWARRAGTLGNY